MIFMPFSLIPRIKYRKRQAEEMLHLCRENIQENEIKHKYEIAHHA